MSVLRFTIPLLVFIYVGALFSIWPSIREALIDLDSHYDQKWGSELPEGFCFLDGHEMTFPARLATRIFATSHWSSFSYFAIR